MSGGQHRNDEVNGPSRSGERETERCRKAREQSTKRATAQTRGCAYENKKLDETFLTEPTSLEMFSTPNPRCREPDTGTLIGGPPINSYAGTAGVPNLQAKITHPGNFAGA
jgi:hypothetical protein